MTSYFDAIRVMIDRASNDKKFEEALYEVFPIVAESVRSREYSLKKWFREEYDMSVPEGDIDLNFWNEYFDEVHDLDHMTDHHAFTKKGYSLLYQLKRLLETDMAFEKDYKLLFKISPKALEWFEQNFDSLGEGLWMLSSLHSKMKERIRERKKK